MSTNGPPAAIASSYVTSSSAMTAEPSWNVATMTSASPLASSPSDSWAATLLTASTGSPKSSIATPSGLTSAGVSSVTAPITPTSTPSISNSAYSGNAGSVVSTWYTLAPRYGQSAAGTTRSVRSAKPMSNSWLPTADTVRSRALRTSIVG